MQPPKCLQALFPDTRCALLGVLLAGADRWWYLTELATALEKTPSSLQRELQALVEAELLERRTVGRKVYFRISANSAVIHGLQQVFDAAAARSPA
jgi:DNA-binding transcriptional ArsR family regulator